MSTARRGSTAVAIWLFACAALVVAMILLGGVTRLTESGLSIVEWRPVTGVLPPLDEAAWQRAFEDYQKFPEYRKVNRDMSLGEFKTIFWFEYAHRLLGRLIGVVFLAPLVVFALMRRVDRPLVGRLAVIFLAGGLQGALGWYMVASGLVDRPDVSQYRLAAHLVLAVVIYLLILWTALDVARGASRSAAPPLPTLPHEGGGGDSSSPTVRPLPLDGGGRGGGAPCRGATRIAAVLWAYLGLVFVTLASGAFVAGTDAGLAYNTFPRMGDHWVPLDLWFLEPWWLNHFENVTTIQFQHRVLAITTGLVAIVLWLTLRRRVASRTGRRGFDIVLGAAALQVGLGIATLLLFVPIPVAAAHQAGAIVLITAIVCTLHATSVHCHPHSDE